MELKRSPDRSVPDDTLSVVSSMRDARPADYIMTIEPFSLLEKLLEKRGDEKYESNEFEAGGYKWRLNLYPNGNKISAADGYISLYLALADVQSITPGSEVNVKIKFFVHDQIRNEYMVLEDGRVRSFHALKSERGISQLLSLNTFKDPLNGFLIEDCCTFGVEITVVEYQGKGEKLIILNEPDDTTFSWKLDKFSRLKDKVQWSEEFTLAGYKWKLKLYPNGDDGKGKYLSIFFMMIDRLALRPGWKLYVDFTLIVKDQIHDERSDKGTCEDWFCASATGWGFHSFVSLTDLNDEKKGFILNDTLCVQAKINFISVVNSFA